MRIMLFTNSLFLYEFGLQTNVKDSKIMHTYQNYSTVVLLRGPPLLDNLAPGSCRKDLLLLDTCLWLICTILAPPIYLFPQY